MSQNELSVWSVRWSQIELMPKYERKFRINKHATVVAATIEEAIAMIRAHGCLDGAEAIELHSTHRISQRGGPVLIPTPKEPTP